MIATSRIVILLLALTTGRGIYIHMGGPMGWTRWHHSWEFINSEICAQAFSTFFGVFSLFQRNTKGTEDNADAIKPRPERVREAIYIYIYIYIYYAIYSSPPRPIFPVFQCFSCISKLHREGGSSEYYIIFMY